MNSAPQEKNHNFLQKSTFTKFAVCTEKFYEYGVIEGDEKRQPTEKLTTLFRNYKPLLVHGLITKKTLYSSN